MRPELPELAVMAIIIMAAALVECVVRLVLWARRRMHPKGA